MNKQNFIPMNKENFEKATEISRKIDRVRSQIEYWRAAEAMNDKEGHNISMLSKDGKVISAKLPDTMFKHMKETAIRLYQNDLANLNSEFLAL